MVLLSDGGLGGSFECSYGMCHYLYRLSGNTLLCRLYEGRAQLGQILVSYTTLLRRLRNNSDGRQPPLHVYWLGDSRGMLHRFGSFLA